MCRQALLGRGAQHILTSRYSCTKRVSELNLDNAAIFSELKKYSVFHRIFNTGIKIGTTIAKISWMHKILTQRITNRVTREYASVMVARKDSMSHVCSPSWGQQAHVFLLNGLQNFVFYTPETGAVLGTLLCEGFCLFCTTPFTEALGVLIEYKRINKSCA
jgi:hypothetical protein